MRTTGDVNQGRFDAIVAALDDITDAERVEAELRAVRAEAEARVAVANADAERQRVETAAARVLAEESNAASISATGALGVSTVQVETLTLRVTDAEATEAELRTQLGERGGQIEALQAAGEAAAKSLAELTATAGSGVSRETSTVSRLFASKARSTTLARRSLPPNGSGRPRRGAPSGTGRLGSGLNVSQPSSHARVEAAETLSSAHRDSARRADEARHGAEARADAAQRVAADERERAPTMADLLRQAQENEAASRRQADAAERKGAEPRAGPPDKERRQEDEQQ